MKLTTLSLAFVVTLTPIAGACGPPSRQERAVNSAEHTTAAAQRDADDANRNVETSQAAEDVLRENDPDAISEANRVLEATPEEELEKAAGSGSPGSKPPRPER